MQLKNLQAILRKGKTLASFWGETSGLFESSRDRAKYCSRWFKGKLERNLGIHEKNWIGMYVLNLKISGRPVRLAIRPSMDSGTLYEVFHKKLYQVDPKVQVEKVLDIGSNIGCSVLFFASLFPNARFVCYEPVRENYDLLVQNIRDNGLKQSAETHMDAISDKTGVGTIYLSTQAHPGQHSLILHSKFHRQVGLRDINSFGERPFDLIKIDSEGSEDAIFRKGTGTLINAKILVGELHQEIIGNGRVKEIMAWLEEHFDVEYRTREPTVNFVAYNKALNHRG